MNKNFSQLKTNVGGEVQDTSTTFATIIGRFINRRYFQILRAINWKDINTTYTITGVSGTQNYALPDDFYKPVSAYNVTSSNGISLIDLDEFYRNHGSEATSTGEVERAVIYEDAVHAQPPSGGSIVHLHSSDASDTSITIQIRGIVASTETTETLTLNGTLDVTSVNTWQRIKGISFSGERAGHVTLVEDTGGTYLIQYIGRELLETRYKLIKLHYIPTSGITIALPYIVKPLPLSQDYDYPRLDIADLIELGAISDAWKYKRQFQKAQTYELMFTQQLADYIFDQENTGVVQQFAPTTYNKDNLY